MGDSCLYRAARIYAASIQAYIKHSRLCRGIVGCILLIALSSCLNLIFWERQLSIKLNRKRSSTGCIYEMLYRLRRWWAVYQNLFTDFDRYSKTIPGVVLHTNLRSHV